MVLLGYVVVDDPGSLYWVVGLRELGGALYPAQRLRRDRRVPATTTDER